MPDGSLAPCAAPGHAHDQTTFREPARRSRADGIRVTVAETFDDLVRARVIRGIVWLSRDGARYDTQFDRNDLNATHLLVWQGEEPVGTMRIRWLPDHARFEKLSVREEYRSLPLFRRLASFAMRLCAAKGYRAVTSLAIDDTVKLWERFGARVTGGALPFTEGNDMVPMIYDLSREGAHPALADGVDRAGDPSFELALFIPEADLPNHVATPVGVAA